MFTLNTLRTSKDSEEMYQEDDRLREKLRYLDLEVVMQHKLTLKYFDQFIADNAKQYEVYLNFYGMVETYRTKLLFLH